MENLRQALYAATGKDAKKAIKDQAAIYEDITLSAEKFPDECLDLIIEILSVSELFTKPGIDIFLLKTSTDMYRLTGGQKQRLFDAICDHYGQYTDKDLCWLLGDLIARNYDRSTAMQAFRTLFNLATAQGKKGVALGLDVLAKQSKHDPQLMKEIEAILS